MYAVDAVNIDVCRLLGNTRSARTSKAAVRGDLEEILVRRAVRDEGPVFERTNCVLDVNGGPPDTRLMSRLSDLPCIRSLTASPAGRDLYARTLTLRECGSASEDLNVIVVFRRGVGDDGWIWKVRAKYRFGTWLPYTEKYPLAWDGPYMRSFGGGQWDYESRDGTVSRQTTNDLTR
jgi:hypothetical protein